MLAPPPPPMLFTVNIPLNTELNGNNCFVNLCMQIKFQPCSIAILQQATADVVTMQLNELLMFVCCQSDKHRSCDRPEMLPSSMDHGTDKYRHILS